MIRNDLSAQVKSDLVNYDSAQNGTAYLCLGDTVWGDSPIRFYYYDSSSTATADNELVLAATGMGGTGRYVKSQVAMSGTGISWSTSTSAIGNTSLATRTTSTLSLSLVGTGATGTQISSTKDATVRCTVSTSTTSTIGGPATSVVALKICSTNNATEASWTTVGTFESDQTITLAIALNSVQVIKGQLVSDVPAGWYVKLVNTGTGTHSESFVSGQQTIYG